MKLYTEKQVKELLTAQRGNCYVAVLKLSNENIASAATQAPLPGGDSFDDYYGIDPESLFKEDLDDKELQGNYDRFQKSRESAKESYNKHVPILNDLSSKIVDLKELIVSLASYQAPTDIAVMHLKELEIKFDNEQIQANEYYSVMEEQTLLIAKYADWNDRKLFIHWNYLTMLKVTEVPYMEWRSEYENIII
jgi:hypothetical protein|tara:strand:- start:370 stop:948 length:579 start_codon:yes stop_codon:yes gene_type:complete